jgi:hypothetical protein
MEAAVGKSTQYAIQQGITDTWAGLAAADTLGTEMFKVTADTAAESAQIANQELLNTARKGASASEESAKASRIAAKKTIGAIREGNVIVDKSGKAIINPVGRVAGVNKEDDDML